MQRFVRCTFTVLALCLAWSAGVQAQVDSLVLLNPVGGEIFYTNRDSVVEIRWGGVSDTLQVRLEWTTDGRTWNIIVDSVAGLQYQWMLSGMPISTTYQVRVIQARKPTGADNATYTGHNAAVKDGAWNPNSDRVVTVSATPDVWDATIGGSAPLLTLGTRRDVLLDVAWTPDSSSIWVTSQQAPGLAVYSTTDNSEIWSHNCDCSPFKTVVGASGSRAVVAGTRVADVVELMQASPLRHIVSTTDILDVALDSSESRVLLCADLASVYPVAGGLPVVFRKHSGGVLSGAFHPDGKTVATIGGDVTIRLWDATTAVELWSAQDQFEGVRSIAFSPDGVYLAVGMSDSSVTVWNTGDGTLLRKFTGIAGAVQGVEWSPLGDEFVTSGLDNVAHVFSISQNRRVMGLSHQNDVRSAHWSPDGSSILTTSLDGTATTWRIREVVLQADTSGKFSYAPPPPSAARFHTTGGTVAIGDEISIALRMESSSQLQLSDIDSVQFQLRYNSTILYPTQSSIPIVDQRDSAAFRIVTLAPIALPLTNGTLGTMSYRATLGVDSVTALTIAQVKQIGSGPGISVTTSSDSVVVTGICRANGEPRLYNPVGIPLNAAVRYDGGVATLHVQFAEAGPVSIVAYTPLGEECWSTSLVRSSTDSPYYQVELTSKVPSAVALVVVTTATQVCSVLAECVR